jgi:hypothetical protein
LRNIAQAAARRLQHHVIRFICRWLQTEYTGCRGLAFDPWWPAAWSRYMKTFIFWAVATLVAAALPLTPVQAANRPAWCGNSGYDEGPARERGPGTGPYWSGEPTDCQTVWRRGYYRGTDPDPNIRLQLMHGR